MPREFKQTLLVELSDKVVEKHLLELAMPLVAFMDLHGVSACHFDLAPGETPDRLAVSMKFKREVGER